MDTSNKTRPDLKGNNGGGQKSHVGDAASELLHEGRKLANELYEDGLGKVSKVEDELKEYSDELLKKVQDNPLTSVLIAAGVGFLLSTFLKK